MLSKTEAMKEFIALFEPTSDRRQMIFSIDLYAAYLETAKAKGWRWPLLGIRELAVEMRLLGYRKFKRSNRNKTQSGNCYPITPRRHVRLSNPSAGNRNAVDVMARIVTKADMAKIVVRSTREDELCLKEALGGFGKVASPKAEGVRLVPVRSVAKRTPWGVRKTTQLLRRVAHVVIVDGVRHVAVLPAA